jgi:hypothetical protein
VVRDGIVVIPKSTANQGWTLIAPN